MLGSNTDTRRKMRTAATTKTRKGSASDHLSLISRNKVTPQDAQRVLTAAFTADDYIDCIKDLPSLEINPQAYVDGLDHVSSRLSMLAGSVLTAVPHQIIDTLPPGSEIYHRCLRALRKACGIYGILPASYLMSQGLTLVTTSAMKRPFASGGFSDVWKARSDDGLIFAIKHIRTYETDDLKHMKKVPRVCRYQPVGIAHTSPIPRNTAKRSPSASGSGTKTF